MLKLSKLIADLTAYYNEYGDIDTAIIVDDDRDSIREVVSTSVIEVTKVDTNEKKNIACVCEIDVPFEGDEDEEN